MKAILTTLTVSGLLCCASAHAQCCAPAAAKGSAADACCPATPTKDSKLTLRPSPTADVSAVTLKVTGMTCESCARGIQSALTKVAGVNAAQVSFDQGQAAVSYDARMVNTAQLIAAVGTAGFTAAEASAPTTKPQQIFCEGKSAGQLCGHGTADALNLSGAKKAAWEEAARRYNTAVEAATRQLLKDAETTLSPQDLAVVKQWFARGVNTQINQQLAREETR